MSSAERIGHCFVSFYGAITPVALCDIQSCVLIADDAATKRSDPTIDQASWLSTFLSILERLGWTLSASDDETLDPDPNSSEAHREDQSNLDPEPGGVFVQIGARTNSAVEMNLESHVPAENGMSTIVKRTLLLNSQAFAAIRSAVIAKAAVIAKRIGLSWEWTNDG